MKCLRFHCSRSCREGRLCHGENLADEARRQQQAEAASLANDGSSGMEPRGTRTEGRHRGQRPSRLKRRREHAGEDAGDDRQQETVHTQERQVDGGEKEPRAHEISETRRVLRATHLFGVLALPVPVTGSAWPDETLRSRLARIEAHVSEQPTADTRTALNRARAATSVPETARP